MKNLKSSAGILNRTVAAMRLCFIALSMVSVPMFVKPAFVASYEFVSAVLPRAREIFSAWLTRAVLYLLVNCIILAILANSNLQHRWNIMSTSHDEHNPSAAHQKQQQEPIYEEESTERSGTTELKEEEAEVSSVARSERIRTGDVRKVQRPSATSRLKADYRRSASAKSATEAKSLDILQSKEEAETLEATWKAIMEGKGAPLTRQLRKSETWETVRRSNAMEGASRDSSSPVFRKSETWSSARNRTDDLFGLPEFSAGLRKEPSLSQDELNRRVEAYIAKVNNDMKLQREQSLARYMEMVNRGSG